MRSEISYIKKGKKKNHKDMKAKVIQLNLVVKYATKNQWIIEKIKEEIKKKFRNKWQQKHDNLKPMGCSKSSSKRKACTIPLQKQEKSQINNVYLHLKQLEKEE